MRDTIRQTPDTVVLLSACKGSAPRRSKTRLPLHHTKQKHALYPTTTLNAKRKLHNSQETASERSNCTSVPLPKNWRLRLLYCCSSVKVQRQEEEKQDSHCTTPNKNMQCTQQQRSMQNVNSTTHKPQLPNARIALQSLSQRTSACVSYIVVGL